MSKYELPRPYNLKPKSNSPYSSIYPKQKSKLKSSNNDNKLPVNYFTTPQRKLIGYLLIFLVFSVIILQSIPKSEDDLDYELEIPNNSKTNSKTKSQDLDKFSGSNGLTDTIEDDNEIIIEKSSNEKKKQIADDKSKKESLKKKGNSKLKSSSNRQLDPDEEFELEALVDKVNNLKNSNSNNNNNNKVKSNKDSKIKSNKDELIDQELTSDELNHIDNIQLE